MGPPKFLMSGSDRRRSRALGLSEETGATDAATAVIGCTKNLSVTVGLASDLAKQPNFLARLNYAKHAVQIPGRPRSLSGSLPPRWLGLGVRDCSQKRSS